MLCACDFGGLAQVPDPKLYHLSVCTDGAYGTKLEGSSWVQEQKKIKLNY